MSTLETSDKWRELALNTKSPWLRKQYEDAIQEEVKSIAKQREQSRRLLVADDHFQIFFN